MTEKQKKRYNRQLILDEIGEVGQEKLLQARVLLVGTGGLGAPVLQYLVAAGVGHIGIMDADVVSLSNLQRQVLFREDDVDLLKVEKAREYLLRLNSEVTITSYPFMLSKDNVDEIIACYDLVIGATDNFESRILIDEVTRSMKKPFVHGSIGEFEGQVAVFNYQGGASYQDLFSSSSGEDHFPLGVMGVLPGIIGSLQAAETIKIICGIGTVLSNKLLVYNALNCEMNILDLGLMKA